MQETSFSWSRYSNNNKFRGRFTRMRWESVPQKIQRKIIKLYEDEGQEEPFLATNFTEYMEGAVTLKALIISVRKDYDFRYKHWDDEKFKAEVKNLKSLFAITYLVILKTVTKSNFDEKNSQWLFYWPTEYCDFVTKLPEDRLRNLERRIVRRRLKNKFFFQYSDCCPYRCCSSKNEILIE
jgi:hypothetical protein